MGWRLVTLLVAIGCGDGTPTATEPVETLRIGGSEAIASQLLPALADTYERLRDDLAFDLAEGGSEGAIRRLLDGDLDIAVSARPATPVELEQARVNGYDLAEEGARFIVGVNVVAVAVHPRNPTDSLTYDQVIGVFCTRSIDNWSFLGQDDQPIRALTSEPLPGTRMLFEDFFCGPKGIHARVEQRTSEEIRQILSEDATAISFVSLSDDPAKVLGLRPIASGPAIRPTQQNIIRGSYPLYHDVYLYTAGRPEGTAADFIEWIASPAGQEVVDEAHLVPLFLRPERMDEARPLRETIHFEQASATPNQRSMTRLQLLVNELRERAGEYRHIILEGYTDQREENQLELSRARAERVGELLSKDLPSLYFEIIPRGAERPIAPNDTPYGRERNRRVQVYLAAEEAPTEDGEIITEEG